MPPQPGLRRAITVALALSLVAPLVWAQGLLFPFVTPKVFYFQSLVALAFGLLALLWAQGEGAEGAPDLRGWRPDPFLLAFLLFVVVAGIAGLRGSSSPRSLLGTLERRWGALTWAAFLGFYLLLRAHLDRRTWLRALRVLAAVATAVALYGLLRAAGLWPGQAEPVGWSRVSSTLGNPGYLAAYLTLSVALTGYLASRSETVLWRSTWIAAAAAQLAAVLATGTRAMVMGAGVAALVLAAATVVLTSNRKIRMIAGAGITILVLAAMAALVASTGRQVDVLTWQDRLASAFSPETGSARYRLLAWGATIEAVREAPLLGVGPENFGVVWARHFEPLMYHVSVTPNLDRAHNVVVGKAATTGLLGLAAYLAMWSAVGWGIVRAWRREALSGPEAWMLGFGAIACFVYLLFWFEDHSSFLAFVVLAALVGYLASGGEPPGGRGVDGEVVDGGSDNSRGGGAPRHDVDSTELGEAEPRDASPGRLIPAARFGVPPLLLGLAAVLVWHNVRVLNAARNTWDGEYSYEAWDGVENFRAALVPGLPGSEPILGAYLGRLTFLAGHGDSGGPEGPTPRMERALAVADSTITGWAARDPHNPWVHIQRSRFCGILQDVRGGSEGRQCAAESLRRAIELSPRQIRFRHWLANHHLTAGEPDRALQVLDEALDVYGSFGETYYYIARVHWNTGDMEEAVRQAKIAISLGYAGQPAPFVLELSDWLAGADRYGEAADLLESHLALRFRKLARPELETPAGRGFQPWDLPLASRLPLLHWRADRPEEAIRTARFLAHRLGPPEGERAERRDARIRRFVRDVEAGRRDQWEGVRAILDEPSEPANTGVGTDETGVTPSPDPVRDESAQGSAADTGDAERAEDAPPRRRGLHAPGGDGGDRRPRSRRGDRAAGPAPAPRDDRAGAGGVGLSGQAGPGPDAGHRPARGGADPDDGGGRADAGGPGGPHREPDASAGRSLPGGFRAAPARHAALQQPGAGGAGKPLSLSRRQGGADRQQLPGTAPDRALPAAVIGWKAALFSSGVHPLRKMRRHVKG